VPRVPPPPGAAMVRRPAPAPQTDLDAFMGKVLAHRDENWKKLQQYILDEREVIELRGPSAIPIWGDRRDYMWFVRDGFFVRSPLRANGVDIPEAERRKAEDLFLKEAKDREARRPPPRQGGAAPAPAAHDPSAPQDMEGLIRQTRQPEFISSAYFLRFKFEQGTYALVGHESLEGRDVLRIEYYPARLFSHEQDMQQRRAQQPKPPAKPGTKQSDVDRDHAYDAAVETAMNKVSLVTLWVDPQQLQIIKYTFDNVNLDFLPASWLFRCNDLRASMTMGQPFPEVWLPKGVEMNFGIEVAIGEINARYTLDDSNYRLAGGTAKIIKRPEGPGAVEPRR
jgi:hypothetical protein